MKLIQLLSLSALLAFTTSCKSQNTATVDVNGESVDLNEGIYAQMMTNKGDILIKLYYKATPMTVGNFVSLAEGTNTKTNVKPGEPYFDGIIFHRVIADFMVQCGDPQGTGMGGPGYAFPDEFVDTLRHSSAGILSMANSGPNTNGSQFFITDKATPHLDGRHTVFGKVISGLSIVNQIARVPKGRADRPNDEISITKMNIIRVGTDAESFEAFKALEEGMAELEARKAQELMARREDSKTFIKQYTWVSQGGVTDEAAFAPILEEWMANMSTTESGLGYIVLEEGNGAQVQAGDQIEVDYIGYLTSGKIFDSSFEDVAQLAGTFDARRPYAPLPITAGPQGRVIEGWKEGVTLFKRGTKARLIIPSELGYGAQGAGQIIPPNATLVFDIFIHE